MEKLDKEMFKIAVLIVCLLAIPIFLSCSRDLPKENSLEIASDISIKSDSLHLLWYNGVFLDNIEEKILPTEGIRISLNQKFGAPSYIYTYMKKNDQKWSFIKKEYNNISGENKIVVDSIVENPMLGKNIQKILNQNTLENIPITLNHDQNRYDDSSGWILEIKSTRGYYVFFRKYTDSLYTNLLSPLKECLEISELTYPERKILGK